MLEQEQERGGLPPGMLGPFQKYIDDPNVTDVDFNGRALWIRDIYGRKKKVSEPDLTSGFINNFAQNVANFVSRPFNRVDNVLEAETKELRITCVHDSVAVSGKTICIRKTTSTPKLSYQKALLEGYTSKEIMNLLINCMCARMNFIICGEPGVGKTEFAKFLCRYIPPEEKVITIEDNPEWHYKEFRKEADCIELRVDDRFDYTKALKTCMRLNPNRIMLSEVRSTEAVHLIECWTMGTKGITTLHTDDVRKIPDRLLNMMDPIDATRLENNIYDCLDVGVLIRTHTEKDGRKYRYLDQVCFFERSEKTNRCHLFVEHGEPLDVKVLSSKKTILSNAGVQEPFALKGGYDDET